MPDAAASMLLTRAQAQSERFAAVAAERFPGLPILIAPLMALRVLPLAVNPSDFAGLIFTSENGVAAFAAQSALRALPAWCVGDRTAAAARAAGMAARSAGGAAADLLALIGTERPRPPLLHLHGADVASDLAAALSSAGIETASSVIYRHEAQPLTDAARAVLARPGRVLLPLFSPRSARLFQAAAGRPAAGLHVACLSPAVAAAVQMPVARLATAARPEAAAMVETLADLLARV